MAEPLYGTYNPSIDSKGRMAFPNKLRDILGPEFYLVPGKGGKYISVYSPEEYAKFEEKLNTITGPVGEAARRIYIAAADKQTPDKQGRIFIKDHLKAYAEISDEVVVIGASFKAEIWSKTKWDEFNSNVSQADIDAALADLVL
ncbi:MAG: division/cell wall cluster transcriptional repressor MraZ [Ruminococcus sp.]|jgi:MraZ protein|nr:division/cell wall cluster transcriptional repressor MraZ [Ruminococcus sp.]